MSREHVHLTPEGVVPRYKGSLRRLALVRGDEDFLLVETGDGIAFLFRFPADADCEFLEIEGMPDEYAGI